MTHAFLAHVLTFCTVMFSGEPSPRCEPWEGEYAGQDAKGPQVGALWQFMPGAETED